ncbi:MAG: hypothetical protein FK733_09730 [Asgard group archaeon]|nr:hypothetical protein [Asgard group archaeon]
MKRRILRNKKGQIQGVDFALAMVIFMIMFAEIIVLSLSFLEPKYQNLGSRAFESRADQIADAFFLSTGYPNDWEYDYGSEFHSFGLRDISSTELDPNKISRINPLSLYSISYENVKGNLSRETQVGFQFTITSIFDVDSTLTLSQPLGLIDITTSVGDCTIWVFVVAPNSSVIYTQRTLTDGVGDLSVFFPTGSGLLPSGYYTLVVFAQSPGGLFAIDYVNVNTDTTADLGLEMLVQEDAANSGQANIQTANDGTLTDLRATMLYPYQFGGELLSNETITIGSPSASENFNLRIPSNGTSVTLLSGESVAGYSRIVTVFPSLLDDEFGTAFGYGIVPENKEAIRFEKLVIIRECIFKAVLYVWAE